MNVFSLIYNFFLYKGGSTFTENKQKNPFRNKTHAEFYLNQLLQLSVNDIVSRKFTFQIVHTKSESNRIGR